MLKKKMIAAALAALFVVAGAGSALAAEDTETAASESAFFELLEKRKSVREYNGQEVTDAEIAAILKAAQLSPSAMGRYANTHITVIKDAATLAKIDESAAKTFKRSGALYGAPVFILISQKPIMGDELANADYSNAAIAVHDMALAATDLGLGSCYIWGAVAALNQDSDLVASLGLPEGFSPCCGLTVGHTDISFEKRDIDLARISVSYIK